MLHNYQPMKIYHDLLFKFCSIFLFFTISHADLIAQKQDFSCVWPADWVTSYGYQKEFSAHHFRLSFDLEEIPDSLVVHTSGDNRYQLFVNGEFVVLGPLRGDLRHWYYETTDLRPFLKKGKNVIAVVVVNYGAYSPDSQTSVQTGFLLAAEDKAYNYLNTGKADWKCLQNEGYGPSVVTKADISGYYGGGAKELIDGHKYPWGWRQKDFDDSTWKKVVKIEKAYARTCKWASRWKLTSRSLPFEARANTRFDSLRLVRNAEANSKFPLEPLSMKVKPGTKASFVLDQGFETTAYPILNITGGKGASIRFTYVEAPYIGEPKHKDKGNRNEIADKNFIGFSDLFISDGGSERIYSPLWWRAFRYIKVEVLTEEEGLVINDIHSVRTHYPFRQRASISLVRDDVDNVFINKVLETGDRTMLACSHEHFMDCPYYEESQFVGDTRIEALVSYYFYGDPALGKQAIDQFSWSINDEGFLSARYPTNSLYYIPNFSIYWIGMLYDYMMLFDDPEFIRSKLPIMRMILAYFERHERGDLTLSRLMYHQFADWSFKAGEPPYDDDGYSAVVDLHYLMALQWAASLEHTFGQEGHSIRYNSKAKTLSESIRDLYWDEGKKLFTDTPSEGDLLSQHTNCLAILTGVTKGQEAKDIALKILEEDEIVKATLYWQFYLFEALHTAGLGEIYLDNLQPWRDVLKLGVTTWPETGPNSRSECHGWGSSPNYHIFKIVAGITSESPGFKDIRVTPNLGDLSEMDVTVPHELGEIIVELNNGEKKLRGFIDLPEGTKGSFIWMGQNIPLNSGKQKIAIPKR